MARGVGTLVPEMSMRVIEGGCPEHETGHRVHTEPGK